MASFNPYLPSTGAGVAKTMYDKLQSYDYDATPDHQQLLMRDYQTRDEVRNALKKERERGNAELVYKQMSPELKRDKEFMKELLREDTRVWKHIQPELRESLDMRREYLASENRHMAHTGQAYMYERQLDPEVLRDERIALAAYEQAYLSTIRNGPMDEQQNLARQTTMAMVIRANADPKMQQELNEVERKVIEHNKDDVAKRAVRDPQIMDAVEARAPQAKKEIEVKRQQEEMVYFKASEVSRGYDAASRGGISYEQAGDNASGIGYNVRNQVEHTMSAREMVDNMGDHDQRAIDNPEAEYEGQAVDDISMEEMQYRKDLQDGRYYDSDGDGLSDQAERIAGENPYGTEEQEEEHQVPFSPFQSYDGGIVLNFHGEEIPL